MQGILRRCRVVALSGAAATAFAIAMAAPAVAGNPGFDTDKESQDHPAELLVMQKCIMCHDLTIVMARRGTVDDWKEILARMVTYGAQVSDEEIASIIDYLSVANGPE